jgi:hypothetical protein
MYIVPFSSVDVVVLVPVLVLVVMMAVVKKRLPQNTTYIGLCSPVPKTVDFG